jgi:hypothetical protein
VSPLTKQARSLTSLVPIRDFHCGSIAECNEILKKQQVITFFQIVDRFLMLSLFHLFHGFAHFSTQLRGLFEGGCCYFVGLSNFVVKYG